MHKPNRLFLVLTMLAAFSALAYGKSAAGGQSSGDYTIQWNQPRQVIRGLGFEIQSDSIGSGNSGMPNAVIAVPHDLTPAERTRFYHDMLHGFRYARLAMGLYLRGLDKDQKHIIGRYPGQMSDLKQMMVQSGIQGFDVEYWSPAPYWKSNHSYYGGTIRSTDPKFLNAFSNAMVQDLDYLTAHGLRVAMWSLQNEPYVSLPKGNKANHNQSYATCRYTPEAYYKTLKVVAPKIHRHFPDVLIHVDSGSGNGGPNAALIRKDPALMKQVYGWSWHRIGSGSDTQITEQAQFMANAEGKPVFQTEFEYQPWSKIPVDRHFINTAQSIMNWFVFEDSPTWFWLHALKPIGNEEARGYSLGLWRPPSDKNMSTYPDLQPGHWTYNLENWDAIAGFLRYLPWDSTRLAVHEDMVRGSNRILAWRTKEGKFGLSLSNRGSEPFTFRIHTSKPLVLLGHRYTAKTLDEAAGERQGKLIEIKVPPQSVEFWVQD